MKFGSIWQRLRSSFANSAGTIVFGMEDSAKTVLIAGPPVPSLRQSQRSQSATRCCKRASTSTASSKLAFVPRHPFRRRWEMGFIVLHGHTPRLLRTPSMRAAGIAVRVQNRRNQVCFRTIPVLVR